MYEHPGLVLLFLGCLCFCTILIAFEETEKIQAPTVAFRATELDSYGDKVIFQKSMRGENSLVLQTNCFTVDFNFDFSSLEKH